MRTTLTAVAAASIFAALAMAPGCGDKKAESAPAPAANAPQVSQTALVNGRNTFLRTCAACHGADAKGMPNNGKDLTASEFIKSQTDEQLLQYVIEGREVPGGVPMPPRGGFPESQLSDDQIKEVIVYLRRFPGNRG